MYPTAPPGDCGFDVAGTAIPADETGGDYYDYLQLPGGGLALAVGDVSGHGFDAALHMVQARTMLRAVIPTQSDPGAVLAQMNSLLLDELDEQPVHHPGAGVPASAVPHAALRERRPHDGLPARRRAGALKAELAQHGRAARA